MVKKRQLSPQSVWDVDAVRLAFEAIGANPKHIPRLYKSVGVAWLQRRQHMPPAAAARRRCPPPPSQPPGGADFPAPPPALLQPHD